MKFEIRLHFFNVQKQLDPLLAGDRAEGDGPACVPSKNYTALGQDDGQCPLS